MGDDGVGDAADRAVVVGSARPAVNASVTEEEAPTWAQPDPVLPRGASIDRYVIVEKLGSGGMGIVYSAFDPTLERKVALKVLRRRAAPRSSKERIRLLREARALARLSHENVAEIYDVGEHGQEIFIALELIDGPTLRQWQAEPPALDEVVAAYIQAGRGLAAAHAAGLVHRDFKPGNAMVDERGTVRVLDFGLATPPRSDDTSASGDGVEQAFGSSVTGTDVVLGTPAYMAPEQAMGRTVDASADQFSFFVALYEALHGKRPFVGRGVTYFQAIEKGRMQSGPHSAEVPRRLTTIIERGLSFDPKQRWPSLADALERLDRPSRSRWWTATGLAAATMAVALAWPSGQVRCDDSAAQLDAAWGPHRQRAVGEVIRQSDEPYAEATALRVADGLTTYAADWLAARTSACTMAVEAPRRFDDAIACLDRQRRALQRLTESLATSGDLSVEHAVNGVLGLARPSACIDVAPSEQPDALPRDPALRSRVVAVHDQLDEAKLAFVAGRYQDSLTLVQSATERAKAIAFAPLVAHATHRLGVAQLRAGQTELGAETLAEAYWLSTEIGRYAAATDIAARLTTAVGNDQKRFDDGLAWARHGQGALGHLEDGGKQRATLLMATASIHLSRGEPERAMPMLHEARALRENLLGPDDPKVASALTNESLALVDLDRADEAITLAERALQIRIRIYGGNHPRVADAQRNVAHACSAAGRHDDALHHNRETLRMREAALGEDHPRVAATLNGIGTTYLSLGRLEEAGAAFERAVAIWDRDTNEPNPSLPQALHNLSDVRLAQGRTAEALRHSRRSLELAERFLGADNPNLTYPLTGLAKVHLAAGRGDDALRMASRARALTDSTPNPRANAWNVYFTLAQAQWETGAPSNARRSATEAQRLLGTRSVAPPDALASVDEWLTLHPLPDTAPSIP